MATLVRFLKDEDGEVFAYFPQLKADNQGNKTSYAHTGQHSACNPAYAAECQPANPFQYERLLTELKSVGYDSLRVLNKTPDTYTAQFNCFEITLPADVVQGCYHSGRCDYDIENCRLLPEVIAELNKLDPEKLAKELREYGAWDDTELSNHDENLNRILWIAAGDIQEGR